MVVIFFNLGLVLAFILLVSIVFINASTKFVLAILGVICILFLIKDIIQDLYFALYKYKNNVLIVIISFALDIARIAFFYKLIHHFCSRNSQGNWIIYVWMDVRICYFNISRRSSLFCWGSEWITFWNGPEK